MSISTAGKPAQANFISQSGRQTPAVSKEKLEEFYRKVRPGGFIVARWYKKEVKALAQTGTFISNQKKK